MKSLKKLEKLILMAMIILFPFSMAKAAEKISVPISVEWNYEGQKWANSPHFANVIIQAQNGAPEPSVSSFNYPGDYKIEFYQPNFTKAGKYEYLIYQTNQDFKEEGRTVTFDKSKYRLIFFVQNGPDGLITTAYAYNEKNYDANDLNANKESKITFVNDDPHIHKNNGEIVDPSDPYHPFHPNNPWYPYDPNNPINPYLPSQPNRPTDPTNPDRNEDNTPIYPTEPIDPENPNNPMNPSNPPVPGRPDDYWPEYPKPSNPNQPEPWLPWPWSPTDSDKTENPITPANPPKIIEGEKPWWWDKITDEDFNPQKPPIDPTDPENPTKAVDTTRPTEPWWWEILYPGKTFDPTNPDKAVEKPPHQKPWWWDNLFPEIPYNPENPKNPIEDEKRPNEEDDKEDADKANKDKNVSPPNGNEDNDQNAKTSKESRTPKDDNQNSDESEDVNAFRKNGKNRNASDRVKTGIESIGMWLIIMIMSALALYKLEDQKRKKPHQV